MDLKGFLCICFDTRYQTHNLALASQAELNPQPPRSVFYNTEWHCTSSSQKGPCVLDGFHGHQKQSLKSFSFWLSAKNKSKYKEEKKYETEKQYFLNCLPHEIWNIINSNFTSDYSSLTFLTSHMFFIQFQRLPTHLTTDPSHLLAVSLAWCSLSCSSILLCSSLYSDLLLHMITQPT